MSLIGWNKILASKKNGGLGFSTIYGIRGALDNSSSYSRISPWLDIVNEVRKLASKGIDLLWLVKMKVRNDKHVSVVSKLRANSLISSFRQSPQSGIKEEQLLLLISNTSSVILPNINGCSYKMGVSLDKLSTRLNLSLRGLDIPSIICPLCRIAVESTSHLLFSFQLAR
ncbi:hypothetical protein Tco_1042320 [Tanacetum coccineum]|uniref:Uncharacterized protein n=1 Tax=Tanacetum coccineum TaxID=301880 RepID=A0ABQ5GJB3_9ASTR